MLRPVLAAAAALALWSAPAVACDRPGNLSDLQSGVISGINAARADAGLPALRENSRLTRAAQAHACDNAGRGSVSHTGSDGSDLTARLRGEGYRFSAAAENTGRGFGSAEAAVDWWMSSSGHRANILMDGLRDIGVGVAMGDGKPHWVINFGRSR